MTGPHPQARELEIELLAAHYDMASRPQPQEHVTSQHLGSGTMGLHSSVYLVAWSLTSLSSCSKAWRASGGISNPCRG